MDNKSLKEEFDKEFGNHVILGGDSPLRNWLLDWMSDKMDLQRKELKEKIHKDLLEIADKGELEELRSNVEYYFK